MTARPRRVPRPGRLFALTAAIGVVAASLVGGVLAPRVTVSAAATAMLRSQALTPPMGFNDWNAYGCDVSAALIERTADAMVANGMAAAGYRYVDLDDCWMTSTRAADGSLVADPARFPDGIAALARYVHARGLLLGIYADAGTTTCAGFAGSYGHEQQDATTFAAWGVDLVKYDQCTIPWSAFGSMSHARVDALLYTRFADAIAATGRRIVLSACTGVDTTSDPASWAPAVSNLWRTTPDITDSFASTVAIVRADARAVEVAGPGSWADPDMLEIGNGGSSDTEYRAEFSLWAVLAAPLLAGTDLVHASAATLAIYENAAVIAVDQDPLGAPAVLVEDDGTTMTFVRPLEDGDTAVVLVDTGSTAMSMSVAADRLGLTGATTVTDLWAGTTSPLSSSLPTTVGPHTAVMYRVHHG